MQPADAAAASGGKRKWKRHRLRGGMVNGEKGTIGKGIYKRCTIREKILSSLNRNRSLKSFLIATRFNDQVKGGITERISESRGGIVAFHRDER